MVTKTSENFQAFIFISLKKKKKVYSHSNIVSDLRKKVKGVHFVLTYSF